MRKRRQLSPFMTFRITGNFKRGGLPGVSSQQDQARNSSSSVKAPPADLALPGSSTTFMSTPDEVKKQFALAK